MGSSVSDIELFAAVRKHDDRQAFDTLFRTHYSGLCRFACMYLKSLAEAEEVVSDVFLVLWKRRKEITITSNVRAYLFTCVKHESLASIERRRFVTEPITPHTVETAIAESSPIHELEFGELAIKVNAVVDSLPPQCRQIFIMSRFDGLKYKEIAEILCLAEKTVENQLIKAIRIMRDSLHRERSFRIRSS